MTRPTTKIKCRECKRTVSAIIVKDYSINKSNPDDQNEHERNNFQKLIIKDHRRTFWKSIQCRSSGKQITVHTGTDFYDDQTR